MHIIILDLEPFFVFAVATALGFAPDFPRKLSLEYSDGSTWLLIVAWGITKNNCKSAFWYNVGWKSN